MSGADDVQSMREALRALVAAPAQLASFGVERATERDALWSERLTVRGDGQASLTTTRSFGDASGEAIGRFEGQLADEPMSKVIHAIEAVLSGGAPPNLSPGDVRVLLSVVAAGARWERVVGGAPPDLEPFQPLLQALDAAAVEARARPVATLTLGLALGAPVHAGTQQLPIALRFENQGSSGYWLRNPCAGMEDEPAEHVRLWYAQRPIEEPGVTPLPVEPFWVALEPAARAERPLVWLGPSAIETRAFVAPLEIDPGSYLFRASFASYGGAGTVAGQPLMRGCAFSGELAVKVAA